MKTRYALVGVSGRSRTYADSLRTNYRDRAEIVALLDSNPARIQDFNENWETRVPGYRETEFDRMVAETCPDRVLVTTTDATHHQYIVAALERNVDAIAEKPMTIDAEKVRAILAAEEKSRATVQVTFNYRYTPIHSQIKALLLDGAVGTPTQIEFNCFLDTLHGASFFKRWNRYERQAGSLLISKACHSFDLVNWWLERDPVEVYAYGKLNYYGASGPENPEKIDGRRCSTCPTKCAYFTRHAAGEGSRENERLINFNNPGKNEKFGVADNYFADRCLFDSDIDTWDTFSLVVLYEGGVMMTFSLNASTPYEGYKLAINGTAGRLETDAVYGSARLPFPPPKPQNIRHYPLFDGMRTLEVINKGGGHNGGDPLLCREIFVGRDTTDRLKRYAGARAGALAVLVGVAAREALRSGKPVKIADLLAS